MNALAFPISRPERGTTPAAGTDGAAETRRLILRRPSEAPVELPAAATEPKEVVR